MSTQHPDNVTMPFFATTQPLGGEDEITEAYYVFSHLGCQEQMWDFEGKEVDEFVVRKLLSRYPHFFQQHPLGKEFFLTLRAPNPSIEKTEAKVLLEVLESIPRSFDASKVLYDGVPPIFELILPMTRSAAEIERIRYYYENFVGNKGSFTFPDGTTVREWIGDIEPRSIEVIPLFEDMESVLAAADIVADYLADKDVEYQRVFLARSDPALNYGHLAAILSLKVSLARLDALEERLGKPIFPILGVGSCPFRGNLKPTNIENCLRGYPSVQTFTIQSAFKYDYPAETVVSAISRLNETVRGRALPVPDEDAVVALAHKAASLYQAQLACVAPLVQAVSSSVPPRRQRKLHIGLFGYSRESASGLRLPRAITFCAALYSIGLPPELLGYSALTPADISLAREVYPDFNEDLGTALAYFNPESLTLVPDLAEEISSVVEIAPHEVNEEHRALTTEIIKRVKEGSDIQSLVVQAAWVRRFLG
jgi:phosphoenolpyruvate carboxylase